MSLLFNLIKEEAQNLKDNFTPDEIAKLIVDNELGINQLKRRLIREYYNEVKGTKKAMDIMVDIEELFGVCDKTIRNAIQE